MFNQIWAVLGIIALLTTGFVLEDPEKIEQSYGRECLALVGYAEARDQGETGMAAVMQVVLNRTHDKRFPDSICEVVQQKNQFLALEKWRYPRHPDPIDLAAWEKAHIIADNMIANVKPALGKCESAIYFDQGNKSLSVTPLCKLGVHYFYN